MIEAMETYFSSIGLSFTNIVSFLRTDCRLSRGFESQIVGKKIESAASSAIISYVLSRAGLLSQADKSTLIEELLSFQLRDGAYHYSFGTQAHGSTWSTGQSCLTLLELGSDSLMIKKALDWLCHHQVNGGWSHSGQSGEEVRLIYSVYPILALNRAKNFHSSYAKALRSCFESLRDTKPETAIDSIISLFLQCRINKAETLARSYDYEALAKDIATMLVNESRYDTFIHETGVEHFYIRLFVPALYMFTRSFIDPSHPISLYFVRSLIDNVKQGKGWSRDNGKTDPLYSWTTALGLLTAMTWVNDSAIRNQPLNLPSEGEIKQQLLDIIGAEMTLQLVNRCPMNYGKCNQVAEIKAAYSDNKIFIDIPYKDEYADYEDAIIQVVKNKGFEPVLAKEDKTSDILLCKVCKRIQTCRAGIADISYESLNIPYELGFMHALSKNCVILKAFHAKQPSDVQGKEHIPYKNSKELKAELGKWIDDNLS